LLMPSTLTALPLASLTIASIADASACGMRPSDTISWAMNCTSRPRFASVSGMAVLTSTSYPFPHIRERRGERTCSRSWMLHAPTKMKSQGTFSTFTLAPALCGLRPEMGKRFSCMAVRMKRC